MTSVTLRTHPTPRLAARDMVIATTDVANATVSAAIFDMVAYVLSRFPALADAGVAGYSYFFGAMQNPLDGGNTTVGGILVSTVLAGDDDSTPAALDALWAPVLDHIAAAWPGIFHTIPLNDPSSPSPPFYPSFYAWFRDHFDTSPAGNNTLIGSRLLDERALTSNLTRSAAALTRFAADGIGTAYLIAGRGVRNAKPRGGGNAVCPAWRKTYVHASMYFPCLDDVMRRVYI